jgi:prolyl-tRNA editing enzyme YbaK/EbsC (Cys-tRNA(Pro) deacylase)
MTEPEERLKRYLRDHGITAEHHRYTTSCHSVAEAAASAGVTPLDFIKSICLIDDHQGLIVAVVKGEDRVSRSRVGQVLGISRPRIASPEEVLQKSGYPAGGTPPFGFQARFLIDPRVLEMETVWGGGGSAQALIRIAPLAILAANGGQVARVRR